MNLPDATPGQRYQITCRRQRSKFEPVYLGTFIGLEGDEAVFELEDMVRLRVDDWALIDLEPAQNDSSP